MKSLLIGNSLLTHYQIVGKIIYKNIFLLISFRVLHIFGSILYTIFLIVVIRNFMYSYWLINHSLESTLLYICENFLHSLDFINSIIIQHINCYCRRGTFFSQVRHRYFKVQVPLFFALWDVH